MPKIILIFYSTFFFSLISHISPRLSLSLTLSSLSPSSLSHSQILHGVEHHAPHRSSRRNSKPISSWHKPISPWWCRWIAWRWTTRWIGGKRWTRVCKRWRVPAWRGSWWTCGGDWWRERRLDRRIGVGMDRCRLVGFSVEIGNWWVANVVDDGFAQDR